MKLRFVITCAAWLLSWCGLNAASIVIMTVEDPNNYDAVRSMRAFADGELKKAGHKVTLVEGDRPEPHHFAGLEAALKDADLLVVFTRRRCPPAAQMAAIKAHLNAGKPLLGIRTANHAFLLREGTPLPAPGLTAWPEFSVDILGGQNTGYETKGMPYQVVPAPGAEGHPVLTGVKIDKLLGHQSLYQVLPLAADATPLLIGTASGVKTAPQPVAWYRRCGAKKSRVFYTSLGAPEDMLLPDMRRLLVNAVAWTLLPCDVADK
jgi:type 1 glutamine amidotransferase